MDKKPQFLNPLLEEDNLKSYYQIRNDQMKRDNTSTQPSNHNKNRPQNQTKKNSFDKLKKND